MRLAWLILRAMSLLAGASWQPRSAATIKYKPPCGRLCAALHSCQRPPLSRFDRPWRSTSSSHGSRSSSPLGFGGYRTRGRTVEYISLTFAFWSAATASFCFDTAMFNCVLSTSSFFLSVSICDPELSSSLKPPSCQPSTPSSLAQMASGKTFFVACYDCAYELCQRVRDRRALCRTAAHCTLQCRELRLELTQLGIAAAVTCDGCGTEQLVCDASFGRCLGRSAAFSLQLLQRRQQRFL